MTRAHVPGRRRWAAVVAAGVAVVGLLAACTSSGGGNTPDPSVAAPTGALPTAVASLPPTPPVTAQDLAALMQEGFATLGSARLSFSTGLAGTALSGTGSARFANGTVSALDITDQLTGVGAVRFVVVGDSAYARPPQPPAPGKPYALVGASRSPTLDKAALALEATELLAAPATYRTLVAAASDFAPLGATTVGTSPALHYRLTAQIASVPSGDQVGLALTALEVTSLVFELWVDGLGRPLKVSAAPPGGAPSEVALSELNRAVSIAAPPDDQVAR